MSQNRETLKAIALQMVNDAREVFGLEPLSAFIPCYTSEDDDTVIEAIREASGVWFQYGETEGSVDAENHWLSSMEDTEQARLACEKLATAWATKTRREDDGTYEVSIPAPLAEFAYRVALEGEYPELVKKED